MSHPRFLGYLVAQFLGALNDNAFKLTVVLFGLEQMRTASAEVAFSSLMTGLFPLPWLFFSQWAGFLADRFRKDRVLLMTKLPEVVSMLLGVAGFYLESLPLLVGVFLLMSAQSAFFSPAKYGLLPEVLGPEDLAEANGVLSMATNIATLLGTLLGVELFGLFYPDLVAAGWIFVGLAVAGTLATLYLPHAPPGHENASLSPNPFASLRDDANAIRRVLALPPTVVGLAYFSFLGSLLLAVIPVYGTSALGLSTELAGRLLLPLVVGLAAGSVLAGFLSRGRVELGLVPFGALILSVFSLHLWLRGTASRTFLAGLPLLPVIDFLALGVGAGFFSVPLSALLQQRSPDDQKGRVIAFSNVLSNLAILGAAACGYLLTRFENFDIHHTLLALVAVTVLGTLHIVWLLPDFLLRLWMYLLVNVLYRLRILGARNIPRFGALFVANHVSWIDAILVAAASGRMVRFMMFKPFYEAWPFAWLFRRLHAIPVEAGGSREANQASLDLARQQIDKGHTVCIFAEGAITRTGQLLGFRRGLERIMQGSDAPIVPVCLDGLWGSLFSFEGGRVLLKRPRRFRHPIQIVFGEPLPPTASAFEVRTAVQSLSVDAAAARDAEFRTLVVELVRSVRRNWFRPFAVDSRGGALSYGRALVHVLAYADALRSRGVQAGSHIGVCLEPSVRAALAHWALQIVGAIPVCLPTRAPRAARAALESVGARWLIVEGEISEAVSKLSTAGPALGVPAAGAAAANGGQDSTAAALASGTDLAWEVLALSDLAEEARARESLRRALAVFVLPASVYVRSVLGLDPRAVHEPAAVVFSRGTSGPAKAVVLTHFNVLSNLRAFRQVFDVGPEDVVLGVLPLSSGFGFTGTLCLPSYVGACVAYHEDYLDAEGVARVCALRAPTLLFAPPAALACYARAVPVSAFAALRHAVTGGRLLPADVEAAFRDRFGVQPLEGYGLSECAPLISLNLPDVEIGGHRQAASRAGSSGQPLPGIAVRIRDPESGRDLPAGEPGELWVRGPNVMSGYLNDVPARIDGGGWYATRDLASIDASGFLTLVDRCERMLAHPAGAIPLERLQEVLRQQLGLAADDPAALRFVALPPERGASSGDAALAPRVVYVEGSLEPETARAALLAADCPQHWVPPLESFVSVEELPMLEGGSVDLAAAAALTATP